MLLLLLLPSPAEMEEAREREREAAGAHQIFIVPESSPDLCVPVRRRVN